MSIDNKKNMLIYMMLFSSACLLFKTAMADDVGSQGIHSAIAEVVDQLSININNRHPGNFSKFIAYYAENSAVFQKHSSLIDNDDQNIILAEKSYNMSKNEYIKHIMKLMKTPITYTFEAQIQNISIGADSKYAVATIAIQEFATIISDMKSANQSDVYMKLKISTNCNVSFNIQQTPPLIAGSNCIEKLRIQ